MKSKYIRIANILPIVIALTFFAVGNQMTVLGQTTESSGIVPPSNDSVYPTTDYTGYLQVTDLSVFIPGNTTFYYLLSRRGHDRTVTLTTSFIDGDRVVPRDHFGDSRNDICLCKYRTGDFQCLRMRASEIIARSISVCRVTSPLHRATCNRNVRTPARSY